jgi:phosphomevalonate kinase
MALIASAPGKLVLLGEYSVLFGYPSVVVAVDRRAQVRLRPTAASHCTVSAPGFAPDPAEFRILDDGSVRWSQDSRDQADRFVLVERVISSLARSKLVDCVSLPTFEAVLDSRSFFEQGPQGMVKLGVGSSAALTTALASALAHHAGRQDLIESREVWLGHLLDLHRSFQGGRGSGIDLAASVLGGTVEYRLDDEGRVRTAQRIELPADLHMLFIWTGQSADTGTFLEALSRAMDAERESVDRAVRRLGNVAQSGVQDLKEARTGPFLESVDQFCEAMDSLGEFVGIPILSEEHEQLRLLANRFGVHYKPSGAGGGDIGVAFSDNANALQAVSSRVAELGFRAVPFVSDPTGLEVLSRDA